MPIICKWKKTEAGWKLWKKGKPKVCGEASTYKKAFEALWDSMGTNGISLLQEGPIEYDKPLPPSVEAEKYMNPELYLIKPDEKFGCMLPDEGEAFFKAGQCRTCQKPIGQRSQTPLMLTFVNKADIASVKIFPFAHRTVFSEDFLSLLTEQEKSLFDFRPVQYHSESKNRKCDYFELSCDSPFSFVGNSAYDSDGITCRECGHIDIKYYHINSPLERYLSSSDLPDPLPSCFPIGSHQMPVFCLTRQRWDEIRGHKFAKGLISRPVGVVPDDLCETDPDQHNIFGKCENCYGWRKPTDKAGKDWPRFSPPYKQKHIIKNFKWIQQAQQAGQLDIVRSTESYENLLELIQSDQTPKQDQRLSFRCTDCRILGYVRINAEEIVFSW